MKSFHKKYNQYTHKSNAMTPLNWFTGIIELVLTTGLIGASISKSQLWVQIVLVVLIFLMVFVYCAAYFYFMIKDPDRLQSETYRLAAQELALMVTGVIDANKVISGSDSIAQLSHISLKRIDQ